jgi:mannose-6-phosphate isomerase-like protein (cupin superfamily)
MIIVSEESAPGIDVKEPFKRNLKVLLSPALHEGLDSIAAGLSILPEGGMSDDHEHEEGEMFYVVKGSGKIKCREGEEALSEGTAVWAEPWTSHQLINTGKSTLKILWVLSPPGREELILEKAGRKTG